MYHKNPFLYKILNLFEINRILQFRLCFARVATILDASNELIIVM